MKLKQYKILPSLTHRLDDYPYPIHDWRNEKTYIKDRTTKEWAWEFFRRNRKYQYDHDRYINKGHFPEFKIEYTDEVTLLNQKEIVRDAKKLGFIYDEVAYLKNHIDSYYTFRSVKKNDGTTRPIKEMIWHKYGIFQQNNTLLHDPKLELPDHNFFLVKPSGITYIPYMESLDRENQHSLEPLKPENIVFRLSADKSIRRQIELVEKKLIEKRLRLEIPLPKKSPRKLDDSKYIKYIRMLDALASYGLSKNSRVNKQIATDIVNEIEPLNAKTKSTHNSRLIDWRKPAFHLVESGYLDILDKE